MRRRVTFLLCLLAAVPFAEGQGDVWLQVSTPHFQIVSNANEAEARRAAHQFESMRSVFQKVFPDADLDTTAPMLVLAVQDKQHLQALEPLAYLGKGQLNLVGLFLPYPEKNYVLILLNAPGAHPYSTIYHEYAHFVFSRLHDWMPLWLTEGIAEYYEYTEVLDDKIRIGKGDPYTQSILDRTPLLPLSTLFAVDLHSPYYHEQDKGSIFYAESWLLVHFLKDKDQTYGTHRLDDFLSLLQKNVDPKTAATQAFGDLDQLELDLRRYAAGTHYEVNDIVGGISVDDSSFVVRRLSDTQAGIARAEFLAHDDRMNDARMILDGVLNDEPTNAAAHEIMGYVAFRQGYFDEARKRCEEAIKLDPNSFMARFFYAEALIKKGVSDKASQAAVEENLRAAIRINPSFPQASDGLAIFYAEQGTNLGEARELIEKAVQLVPGVPEIRVDEAQVLMTMHKEKEAQGILELALKMSHTPEQIAAIENVQQSLHALQAERTKQGNQNKLGMVRLSGPNDTKASVQSASSETPPRAIYSPQVEYTEEARRAKLEGICTVSFIVGLDGKVSNVVVTKKLGMGLDERAIETVSKWKFEPGRRNGRPVISHLTLDLTFKIFGGDAQKYFDLSERAKSGDANAEFELANAFFTGRDIPKDEAQGIALLERAARSGHPQAQFQMGERTYGDGSSSMTYVEAYVWYALAKRNGAEQADGKVSELESRMTPDQLTDAQKRLQDWSASASK